MRLGVNGWRIHGQRTGVGRYLLNVVRHWRPEALAGRFDDVAFYTARAVDRNEVPLPDNVREQVLRSDLPMLLWENLRLGPAADDDVLFCPSYSRPVFVRNRVVVAIWDAVSRLHPELFPRSVRLFYNRLYGWSARHATLVIAGSEASRRDVARVWGVPLPRIRAVHLAPAEVFGPGAERASVETAKRARLGADDPYFLFVGKLSGRRSLPPLLAAFHDLKRRTQAPHKLLLVGLNPHQIDLELAGVGGDVRHCGYVSDEELNLLYNGADALVMPSVYETLSLPVMEAQATGTPVICIDTAGMREVTGGKALLLERLEAPLLFEAMKAIASDGRLREELAEGGLENSRRFSWERTSSETLAVLAEAAESAP
jgi:glycosyltransferase involved in cell wall biosynthesis